MEEKKVKFSMIPVIICIVFFITYLLIENTKLQGQNNILQDKVQYYEKIVQDFEADELITHPELYSEGYVEQIKVHSCMWAFEVQVCE